MARTRARRRAVPPGERPSRLTYCPYQPDPATPSPIPGDDPLCRLCGLVKGHVRHDEPQGLHDAQAEHRRRLGEREE